MIQRIQLIGGPFGNSDTQSDYGFSLSGDTVSGSSDDCGIQKAEINLRDYQNEAYKAVLKDFDDGYQRVLIVLFTGAGKTILFSKMISDWKGRCLVVVNREELLMNAYEEIERITGEIIGIERASEYHLGERVVVATQQTLVRKLDKFNPNHFSLVILDEAHNCASQAYERILSRFSSAKVVGLTATDFRRDAKKLPFQKCSYRMGIREGVEQSYLVPIRGRRIIVESINLSRIRGTQDGEFDPEDLDNEMVKGAHAIADVIANDYPFDKGILFFPGCQSAKLTCDILNKKLPESCVYVDGNIKGSVRRELIDRLRNGKSNWLANVGIACEGFNWPSAAVIGMCVPTSNRAAYIQRAGRGTRPLQGILDGLQSADDRRRAINKSEKPFMTVLDFVGVSSNLTLIGHESVLDENQEINEQEPKAKSRKQESEGESVEESEAKGLGIDTRIRAISSGIQSTTLHSTESFDPFEETFQSKEVVKLTSKVKESGKVMLSEKQYNVIKRNGIDDNTLTSQQAQELVKFIAGNGFRLNPMQKSVLKKLYKEVKYGNKQD